MLLTLGSQRLGCKRPKHQEHCPLKNLKNLSSHLNILYGPGLKNIELDPIDQWKEYQMNGYGFDINPC